MAAYFAFYGVGDNVLTGQGEPERLSGVPVSENFFPMLGVQPLLGRLFTAEECKWRGPRAVLLSHGLWERRFASDPAIVGQALTLNERAVHRGRRDAGDVRFRHRLRAGQPHRSLFPFPLSPETNRWGNTLAIDRPAEPGVHGAKRAGGDRAILAGADHPAHAERNNFEGRVKPLAEQVSGRLRLAVWCLRARWAWSC